MLPILLFTTKANLYSQEYCNMLICKNTAISVKGQLIINRFPCKNIPVKESTSLDITKVMVNLHALVLTISIIIELILIAVCKWEKDDQ